MEKRVMAVVVTYNRKKLLVECIESLLLGEYKNLDILVVDNASTDGTKEELLKYIENHDIIYENTGKNIGGAGGFNFGLRYAAEHDYDFAWIMDDDCIPYSDTLKVLMSTAETVENFGYLSSKIMWTDGSLCKMNIQRDLNLKAINDFSGDLIPSGAATFVSLLFPISVVKEVGLPIKDFFIWADDLEYTRRISLKYPCFIVPSSVALHKCGTNNGSNISTDDDERIDRYKYAYRNEVYLYKREGISGFVHILLRTPLHILRVLKNAPGKKLRRIKIILFSTLKGIFFNPKIEFVS